MQTIASYSEAGGATKTTASVSLAMVAASLLDMRVTLIDLDPRAASTKWLGVEPTGEGLHVGAILAEPDPDGWANELAVPSAWHSNLRVIPSGRSVSNREKDGADHAETRLKAALEGIEADLVVIDCPNRQGGPLILNALNAADTVLYAARANQDGIDGVNGARFTVQQYLRNRQRLGAATTLTEAGIVATRDAQTFMTKAETESVEQLRETGLLLTPIVQVLTIVPEVRLAGQWYGNYRKGQPIVDAYKQIAERVIR